MLAIFFTEELALNFSFNLLLLVEGQYEQQPKPRKLPQAVAELFKVKYLLLLRIVICPCYCISNIWVTISFSFLSILKKGVLFHYTRSHFSKVAVHKTDSKSSFFASVQYTSRILTQMPLVMTRLHLNSLG